MIGGIKKIFTITKRYGLLTVSLSLFIGGLSYVATPYFQQKVVQEDGAKINTIYWNRRAKGVVITQSNPQIGMPKKISLPRLGIDLDVVRGDYDQENNQWTLDKNHAFFVAPGQTPLSLTAKPLIYGHNIPAVFRNLDGIADGELMYITDDSGRILQFKYLGSRVVEPGQSDALNDFHPNTDITLLTCTSVTFKNRKLLFFNFISDNKSPKVAIRSTK